MQTARKLEKNLHQKEEFVKELFSEPAFGRLKNLQHDGHQAAGIIDTVTMKQRIWLLTFKNNNLVFWSGIKAMPDNPERVKEGSSFLKLSNGYYEVIKKTEGDFTAIAYIPVKHNFKVQNQYLQNKFESTLLDDNNIDIAEIENKEVFHIHNISGGYLFPVYLKSNAVNHNYLYLELGIWSLTLLAFCFLITNVCRYLVHKRRIFLSFGVMAACIIVVRFINLYLHFPNLTVGLPLFNPSLFSLNRTFPNLGDFCINLLLLCWFVTFVYTHRHRIMRQNPGRVASWVIFITGVLTLVATSTGLLHLFNNLVAESIISFDVNNVLNLSVYSILGVVMACFAFLIFYLLIDIFLVIDSRLRIHDKVKLVVFLLIIIIATAVTGLGNDFSFFYIFWSVLLLIRAYNIRYEHGGLSSLSYIGIVIVCALVASTKLSHFQWLKERDTRKQLIGQLEDGYNANVKKVFKTVEKEILQDKFLINYYQNTQHNPGFLKNRFQKLYFDGYLSEYDFTIYEYDSHDKPLLTHNTYSLADFKDMVLYSAIKVSDYFYRENEAFGYQRYFAILPVYNKEKSLGTIIIELKSRPLHINDSFPELLIDKQFKPGKDFKDYSYAFYSDGRLLSQSGSYNYDVVNNQFKGKPKKFVFTNTADYTNSKTWHQPLGHYSHLIYQPSQRKVIVVSRYENTLISNLASFTFFFILLLLFSAAVLAVSWLWTHLHFIRITSDTIHWNLKLDLDNLLYKTRIQFSMVFAVVATLTLVGVITFLSIKSQYQEQQDENISTKVARIASKFETSIMENMPLSEASQVQFNNFADDFSADLTLFSLDGKMLLSTQPKIYSYGLLIPRMHSLAYVSMHGMQKSVIVNEERIGALTFKAAYAPIRNSRHVTVAYLQLPYFANSADYKERVGTFLNAMINIYALIFLAIGLFAVIVARQITAPLNFIKNSLSKTIYGKKNELIIWNRNDEIGSLVKEYNKMITALENSAQKLAQSERESAWREMAKQVAHEIKNPLTPLKLGLQLLEKSWRDKDPKFDIKFERFNKSFVEQIESLSSIASEFSAFAKMPDTKLARMNVFEMLGQAVTIFKQMDNVTISFIMPQEPFYIMADRDQLLRCFNNLLKNAIEAMPESRPGLIEITHVVNRNSLLLNIKDNGNGIPENLRSRIFEPNFTTKSSGTGLGLAFVKNSIENAGGKIWFETSYEDGTNFYLNFPAAAAQ